MGYRNVPIYLRVAENKNNPELFDLFLGTEDIEDDLRHSVPLLREILFEFLQGKYLVCEAANDTAYFEKSNSHDFECQTVLHPFLKTIHKITDNYLYSDFFLDSWAGNLFLEVYNDFEMTELVCEFFPCSDHLDSWLRSYDGVFFFCHGCSQNTISTLEKIIERDLKDAGRKLIKTDVDVFNINYDGYGAWCSAINNWGVGLNALDWSYFSTQPRFDKYPLFLFTDKKGLSLATSPDCQYAALNRLLDGAIYRGLSEHFDLSIEFDMVSKAVFEFAGESDRCYQDGNKLVVRQMDDCMFCDFFRTYTIDTLFYLKGEWGEVKDNPLFKLSFSPMGLNANLIASFEIYDKSVVETIKAVMTDIAEKYKRTLYFDVKPSLTQIPVTVINNPCEHLDIILNGKYYNLKRKEERLRREHNKIMMLRNGQSVPPTFLEKVTAFLNGK